MRLDRIRRPVEAITREVKKYAKQPIIMKLSPNVTDITEMARAAEAGGADVLSLINTLTGMKIDIERQKFAIANKTGGMSGPAVKPIAVRMVYQVAQAVKCRLLVWAVLRRRRMRWSLFWRGLRRFRLGRRISLIRMRLLKRFAVSKSI